LGKNKKINLKKFKYQMVVSVVDYLQKNQKKVEQVLGCQKEIPQFVVAVVDQIHQMKRHYCLSQKCLQ